jgi:hypothetical protein
MYISNGEPSTDPRLVFTVQVESQEQADSINPFVGRLYIAIASGESDESIESILEKFPLPVALNFNRNGEEAVPDIDGN